VSRHWILVFSGSRTALTPEKTQSFRPKLETSLDVAPALLRTPHTMTQYLPISLNLPGPSFSDKGKAKEVLYTTPPPAWFPTVADNEDNRLEGSWWTVLGKDDAYVGGLPSAPGMVQATPPKCKRIPSRRRRTSIPNGSGPARPAGQAGQAGSAGSPTGDSSTVPDLVPPRPKSLGNVIQRSVDKLSEARKMINQTQEFQRIEAEGGVLPPIDFGEADREREREEAKERKRKNQVERGEVNKRRKLGGEVGEKEAAITMKRATASMLAHSGFEGGSTFETHRSADTPQLPFTDHGLGANEAALDMFTRVAIDHVRNMGRTLRLLVDGFSQKMTSEVSRTFPWTWRVSALGILADPRAGDRASCAT
jgi:transcriptional activator SPT7